MKRIFYDYQADAVRCLRDGAGDDWLLEFPTGGGKTTVGSAVMVDRVLGAGPATHGIIAAPQLVIEDGFHLDNITALGFPSGGEAPIPIPDGAIRRAGDDGASVQAVRAYLDDPAPGYVLTCTHAALVAALTGRDHSDYSHMTLLVDEAHHVGARGLGGAVNNWSRHGGRLIFATATPYRADGRPVKRNGMRVYRRTMPEQMECGRYAPEHIAHGIVPVGSAGDTVTKDEFTGRKVSGERRIQEDIAAKMVGQWVALGYPKSIFRVPVLAGGSSSLVKLLKAKLAAVLRPGDQPVRVLDTTGTSSTDARRVRDTLLAERSRSFAQSEVDVIIGVQRVREGLDWPHASTVQSVGLPGSMVDVIQLLGRAMRPKGLDHDSRHRDRGMIRFYVPGVGHLDEYDPAFSRHALAVCVTLADHEAAEGLVLDRIVRNSIANPADGKVRPPASARPMLSPDQRAAVLGVMATTAAQAEVEGRPVTTGGLVDAAASAHPDLARRDLIRIAASILASDPATTQAAGDALRRRLSGLPLGDLDDGLDAVVEEFRNETLHATGLLRDVAVRFHQVAGAELGKWASTISSNAKMLVDLEDLSLIAKKIFDASGRWPSTCRPDESPTGHGIDWAQASTIARRSGYKGLADLLDQRFPKYRNKCYDLNFIANAAFDYYQTNGKWPVATTRDTVDGLLNRYNKKATWANIRSNLAQKNPRINLSKFLDERFPHLRGKSKRGA